jgi:hypothetical protein
METMGRLRRDPAPRLLFPKRWSHHRLHDGSDVDVGASHVACLDVEIHDLWLGIEVGLVAKSIGNGRAVLDVGSSMALALLGWADEDELEVWMDNQSHSYQEQSLTYKYELASPWPPRVGPPYP